uniref:Cysteine and tyrosine-rich protein 1 n=1 Tax=Ciona savignyi TaxID=51511 RepID=H2Y4Y7_CIOSA
MKQIFASILFSTFLSLALADRCLWCGFGYCSNGCFPVCLPCDTIPNAGLSVGAIIAIAFAGLIGFSIMISVIVSLCYYCTSRSRRPVRPVAVNAVSSSAYQSSTFPSAPNMYGAYPPTYASVANYPQKNQPVPPAQPLYQPPPPYNMQQQSQQ